MKPFPALTGDQVCVVQAEVETGIVVGQDGKRDLGTNAAYRVFDSLEEARAFAVSSLKARPHIELVLMRAANDVIEVYRDAEAADRIVADRKRLRRRWWQFWR